MKLLKTLIKQGGINMKKRMMLGFTMMAGLILTGCGSDAGTGDDKTVTVSMMTNETEAKLVEWQDQVIADYEEEHPDVKIDIQRLGYDDYVQTLQTKFASGDAPTIFQVENIYLEKYVTNDYVVDMSESKAKDYYEPSQLSNLSLDEKLYALPYNTNVLGVTYNKEIFEEVGIETLPKTESEFYAACEKLEAAGYTPIASGYKETWAIMADMQADYVNSLLSNNEQAIVDLVSREDTFVGNENWTAVLERLQNRRAFMQSDLFGTSWDAATTMVANEEAVMVVSGQWAANNIAEYAEDMELGMFPLPVSENPDDAKFVVQSATAGLGISAAASEEEQQAAMEFMEYYHSPEVATTYAESTNNICVIKDVVVPETSAVYDVVKALEENDVKIVEANFNFPNEQRNAVETLVGEFMLESDTDVTSILEKLDAEFDRIAKE